MKLAGGTTTKHGYLRRMNFVIFVKTAYQENIAYILPEFFGVTVKGEGA